MFSVCQKRFPKFAGCDIISVSIVVCLPLGTFKVPLLIQPPVKINSLYLLVLQLLFIFIEKKLCYDLAAFVISWIALFISLCCFIVTLIVAVHSLMYCTVFLFSVFLLAI